MQRGQAHLDCTLYVLYVFGLEVTFPAKRSRSKCLSRRRIGQRCSLRCPTPIGVAKSCARRKILMLESGIYWKRHVPIHPQQHTGEGPVYERYDYQDDKVYKTLFPDGCTWTSESTATAAAIAAKRLSHLGGWNVPCNPFQPQHSRANTMACDGCGPLKERDASTRCFKALPNVPRHWHKNTP